MRSISFVATVATASFFGACDPADTYYVTEEGDRYVDIDVTVTPNEDNTDTGTEPTDPQDPCDVEFRAYTEDSHYVDMLLGAKPTVSIVSHSEILEEGSFVQSVLELTSHRGCGEIEILGISAVMRPKNGEYMLRTDGAFNAIEDLTRTTTFHTDIFWLGNTSSSIKSGAEFLWDVGGWSGTFEPFVLDANEARRFQVDLDGTAEFHSGEYTVEYTLHWRDVETGTEIWFANLDDARSSVEILASE